jgi:shikimate kinase
MEDLKRILDAREPLYRKADLAVHTSTANLEDVVKQILQYCAS